MFEAQLLKVPRLRFSETASNPVSFDKLKGLQKFGPYHRVSGSPTFAFVFPRGRADAANTLFRALSRGVALFKGMPTVFRMPFSKDQVTQISGFSDNQSNVDWRARAYEDAIRNWLQQNPDRPDFFFLLHERTPEWEVSSLYHSCKRLLLEEGIVSQSVTFDLIANPDQFGWSVANIALASFCKLGGTPWIVDRSDNTQELIIGVGRADFVDPVDRSRRRRTAYTTCLETRGEYKFSTVGRTTETREEYLASLTTAVSDSIIKAKELDLALKQVTLFITKEFSQEEEAAVSQGIASSNAATNIDVHVTRVTDERRFYLIDTDSPTGLPPRGVAVQLTHADHLLYTEGADDHKTWRGRTPSAIRVRQYESHPNKRIDPTILNKVLDLSQVNFRGFNAVSRPAVLVYSERTARLLECGANIADKKGTLDRMWFL